MAKKNSMTQNNARVTNYEGSEYKYEVAEELGVSMGAEATARENGRVGGAITKKLVSKGKSLEDSEAMKNETAEELGVALGADASSRSNGRVGGAMTKKLVNKGKNKQ